MPVIDEISELDFDHLSSIDRNQDALFEEQLLDGEIHKKAEEHYRKDPDSVKFGREFKDITASGYGYQNGCNF